MKKGLAAVLVVLCLFSRPVQASAEEIHPTVNEFTYEEAQLLMKVAAAEALNQGCDGQWLVMSVILNRVNSSEFPDTIKEVVYQEHQFTTVSNGAIDDVEPDVNTHLALARIEMGEVAEQIVAFETTKSVTLTKYFSEAFTYRDHAFYTLKAK